MADTRLGWNQLICCLADAVEDSRRWANAMVAQLSAGFSSGLSVCSELLASSGPSLRDIYVGFVVTSGVGIRLPAVEEPYSTVYCLLLT